ncbi:MAG: Glutathione S-transferase domain [Phenylobacterium sp.]|nr:Glutathione S-transferase domain [Phenylobacterium sp.]
MTITLYEHPLSPYAQKVKILMREKGLAFEAVLPQGMGAGGARGAFIEANPRAEVPALVDGEVRVFDSTVILEYLEDAYPEPAMRPALAAERARVRMLEEVMDTHFEAITWGLSELSWFRRAEGAQAEAIRAAATRQLAGFYSWLQRQLGDRPWFNGEAFGWGDLSVIPFVNGAVGQGHALPEGSRLADWLARANARPSVAQTVGDVREWSRNAGMGDVADLVAKGLFKREYRDHRLEWMIKSGGLDVVLKGIERDNIRFAPEFS